jgi:hypothetical protein
MRRIEQPGFMNLPEHYKRWVEINSDVRQAAILRAVGYRRCFVEA